MGLFNKSAGDRHSSACCDYDKKISPFHQILNNIRRETAEVANREIAWREDVHHISCL